MTDFHNVKFGIWARSSTVIHVYINTISCSITKFDYYQNNKIISKILFIDSAFEKTYNFHELNNKAIMKEFLEKSLLIEKYELSESYEEIINKDAELKYIFMKRKLYQ
jgi:hypothetical protein